MPDKSNLTAESSQAPQRGHHHLVAVGVGKHAALDPKPKRERKPRDATLIKRTEKAAGRPVAGMTYHPDGSRTVQIGDKAEQQPDITPLEAWRRKRHAG
ncbi:MAG: hypothetical protein ACREDO_07955 [Methyloceanibacter sp.]